MPSSLMLLAAGGELTNKRVMGRLCCAQLDCGSQGFPIGNPECRRIKPQAGKQARAIPAILTWCDLAEFTPVALAPRHLAQGGRTVMYSRTPLRS